MTNQNNAAQAADTTPFSDEYVNAVIQQHGYDSPECVIARLHQWIGLHGGENGVTLLMYEAHKALVKLRAPVADERAAELMEEARSEGHSSVAAYVDQLKTSAATYRQERNSARDAVARYREESTTRVPVADEDDQPTAPDDDAIAECWVTASDCDGIAYDGPSFERGYRLGEIAERDRAALASAPVAEPETMEEIHRQERERSPWKLPKDPTLPDCAPVTDESPMAKMADALREKARQERQAYQNRREVDRVASAPVAGEAPPVAEVVSRYGDPEAFGERDLKVLVDLNSYPYGAKFYAAPQASQAVRDALHELVEVLQKRHYGRMPDEVQKAFDNARAALSAQSELSSGAPNGRKRTAAERRAPMVERVYGTGVTAQPAQKDHSDE
ncbi:hypothetical protein B9P52_04715 [Achromobacter denitrificans]|uniref:hypothetical protein n=1 Tax=Achromobacter denitrificans TaxID=32002 RepID=UPI000B4CBB3F|nr:hypothetical protein [Achromobacter denitrificans]ASC63636.1 hypothetical protein B9P52_04715 [Achromobacter denitrificans]